MNLGSIVFFPLALAAVAALFAWLGWGYRIRDVVVLPPEAVAAGEVATGEPAETATSIDALDSEEVPGVDEPEATASPEPMSPEK